MSSYIAVCFSASPDVAVYPFTGAGFGTKFANPASLPAGVVRGVSFTAAADAIAVNTDNTPWIYAYPFSGAGFGTKFADPSTLPGSASNGGGCAFTSAGDAIAVNSSVTPFTYAYPFSGSGFGTKFADPSTAIEAAANDVTFTTAGNFLAIAHNSGPDDLSVYAFSGAGWGTRTATAVLQSAGVGVDFTYADDAIIGSATFQAPFVEAWKWSGAGLGTKYTNPGTTVGSTRRIQFSRAGDAVAAAVSQASTAFVVAYPWTQASGFGTKYADPSSLPAAGCFGIAFNSTNDAVAVGPSLTPFLTAYAWTQASGFGTKFSDPGTLPGTTASTIAFDQPAAGGTVTLMGQAML